MFIRKQYIDKIAPYINKSIIKVLVGQRRVGKSYLLLQLAEKIKSENRNANIIYIDKEKFEFDEIKTYKDLIAYVEQKKKEKNNYLFIDEIQEIEDFQRALRSLLSDGIYDIYCTGSNAKILSGELATILSGRHIEIKIHSLSFREFINFHSLEANQSSLDRYMKFGGLPYLIHLENDEEVYWEYLRNIFSTIIFKDVVARYEIRDVSFLQNLIKYLADNTGSLFSYNNIAKYLKSQGINKSTNIIIDYISYLENAYFLHKTRRYDVKGKRIFEIGEKLYFEDVGIRNAIIGYKPGDINKVIENVVHHHLLLNGYSVFVGKLNGYEIDFMAEKNNEKIYIQVAYLLNSEETIYREFTNLLNIKDQYPKFVVSMDAFNSSNTFEGITHYQLMDFLLYDTI